VHKRNSTLEDGRRQLQALVRRRSGKILKKHKNQPECDHATEEGEVDRPLVIPPTVVREILPTSSEPQKIDSPWILLTECG
jgi:hypothetical protein